MSSSGASLDAAAASKDADWPGLVWPCLALGGKQVFQSWSYGYRRYVTYSEERKLVCLSCKKSSCNYGRLVQVEFFLHVGRQMHRRWISKENNSNCYLKLRLGQYVCEILLSFHCDKIFFEPRKNTTCSKVSRCCCCCCCCRHPCRVWPCLSCQKMIHSFPFSSIIPLFSKKGVASSSNNF